MHGCFSTFFYTLVSGTANGTVPNTVTSYSDYITRPADHRSVVRFDKGDQEKFCRVTIIDDSLCEKEEKFTVVLTEPMGGKIGSTHSVDVIIEPDKNDGEYSTESLHLLEDRKDTELYFKSGLIDGIQYGMPWKSF